MNPCHAILVVWNSLGAIEINMATTCFNEFMSCYTCRLEFPIGVDALPIAMLYDALYSDDRSCVCVYKVTDSKFEQQS